MKKNKRYKIIIIVLVVYLLVFFLFLGLKNIKNKNQKITLLIGDSTVWEYENKTWFNITSNSRIDNLSWQKYEVFLDNKYKGNYDLWYDDTKWYAFNQDKTPVNLEGELIAYKANHDLKIKNFEVRETTNNTYVHQILRDNNLKTSSQLTVNNVINIDIDNDGINEDIYTISNAFPFDFTPEKYFAMVFMVKEEIIYPIYTNIESAKYGNSCKPFIRAFLDIEDDNNYEIIISCGRYSIQKPEDMLYQLKNNKFKQVISNQ